VRFDEFEFTPPSRRNGGLTYATWFPHPDSVERYGAFRLIKRNEASWDLAFVDLGKTADLDSLIARYRGTIDGVGTARRPTARQEAEFRAASRRLYLSLWKPLLDGEHGPFLVGRPENRAPLIFAVPTSQIHLVDFNTLISPSGELLIEQCRVHLLSSARDLLRYQNDARPPTGRGMLVVGSPQRLTTQESGGNGSLSTLKSIGHAPCMERLTHLEPLPGAEREALTVSDLYETATGESVSVLLDAKATEAAAKRGLVGRRMAHFATHGFFCASPAAGPLDPKQGPADPLLMSGLVLARGSDEDDGLLTGQELVSYDLSDLEWVLLSACGSALGRSLPGEGLFGLRRAFEMAGARTVVTALWQIRDDIALDLTDRIYRRRLSGASTVDSIREAELERLHEQRARRNRVHPVLWGGFVAEGDWR
jgi:CHAT domain-containing protein